MGAPQLKDQLHKLIDQADERFLKIVYAMMKEYSKESKVVGSHPIDGLITSDQLIMRAQVSNGDISKNRLKSVNRVRKEASRWK